MKHRGESTIKPRSTALIHDKEQTIEIPRQESLLFCYCCFICFVLFLIVNVSNVLMLLIV